MGKKRAYEKVEIKLERELIEDPAFKEIIDQIAGKHGLEIARILAEQELTDEELAKRTGIQINLLRKILYDLYDNRVVGYRRARDESSGWYIYYWRIEPDRALEYYNDNKRLLVQKLEERLEYERNSVFFTCKNNCPKLNFELAAENDFKCPRCGEGVEPYDNSSVITALERQIESLRQHLVKVKP